MGTTDLNKLKIVELKCYGYGRPQQVFTLDLNKAKMLISISISLDKFFMFDLNKA